MVRYGNLVRGDTCEPAAKSRGARHSNGGTMEGRQGKERGILKLEPRSRVSIDSRSELTPQGSWDRAPASPQPSVDRLSVTWADPEGSMTSGVNLFHIPSETTVNNEVKFSTCAGDGSEDEDYSASLSAVLRQRRASVRRSRKGRTRRPSSPFLPDDPGPRARRRSSVFTTSSGDTAISIEEGQPGAVTQEQIFENIHLHKEVLGSVKQQPLGMRRKLKIVHQAKGYIKRHKGQLQERLAESKSTRDIYARFNILIATKWQQLKREAANMSNLLIPWELRIKEIESHFGSVVASYFTFLRWLFWVNLVIGFILMVFVIVPEYLTANPAQDGERKVILEEERDNATNLLTLWEFEGALKYSPIFYGYYTNLERPEYQMPLAYFFTGLVVYIYSFVATLRKMAENSRMSKLSEKEDECIFSWKLFTGWDFMIGNAETAHNRIASVILGFKEALLEEAEKKKDLRNWRIIALRAIVNLCVLLLLVLSAYGVVTVVSRSDDNPKGRSWWRENETTIVVTIISITFPFLFDILGYLEHYHPRKQLRLQLARIMLLNLLNLYSLIFALFSKIEGMSAELDHLKPSLNLNASVIPENVLFANEPLVINMPTTCSEVRVPCPPDDQIITLNREPKNLDETTTLPPPITDFEFKVRLSSYDVNTPAYNEEHNKKTFPAAANLLESSQENDNTTKSTMELSIKEKNKIKVTTDESNETNIDYNIDDYSFDFLNNSMNSTDNYNRTFNFIFTSSSHPLESDLAETTTTVDTSTVEDNWTNFLLYDEFISNISDIYTSSTNSSHVIIITTDRESEEETYGKELSTVSIFTEQSTITDTISVSHETESPNSTTDLMSGLVTDEILHNNSKPTGTEVSICPRITFNCSIHCGKKNITQVFTISNCSFIEKRCYIKQCVIQTVAPGFGHLNQTNVTLVDVAYIDENNRTMYNLTTKTKKKLLKLCWETMFGQELVKLTMMDLVFVLLGTLFMDFFRALFVRYMNKCWCWDLEKKFPEYGDFKIAENILHLINNQGMVWMGMFFSPGLVVLNVFKLTIMMYLRSWTVMTCNVPHEVVFRVSRSNNFYLALLLTMLFLCVLPVGYSIVWVKPSWHCGPFSKYQKIYHILTSNIYTRLPTSLNFALECIASPAIVIPILVLLILIIYYLTSLTNSLREANNDLKIQLRRERTEERRKMFRLADTRTSEIDNTPFARWKRALPSLPLSKSIDSDERKTVSGDETQETKKVVKKRGGIFAKIVNMALDRKSDIEALPELDTKSSVSVNVDDETDTDFHETLPKEVLKVKDITVILRRHKKHSENYDDKDFNINSQAIEKNNLKVNTESEHERSEIKAVLESQNRERIKKEELDNLTKLSEPVIKSESIAKLGKIKDKQISESSTHSKQSDSLGSVIPVITISTTESDEDILKSKEKYEKNIEKPIEDIKKVTGNSSRKNSSESKSLKRQNSVDSINEHKASRERKSEEGHKYQYSL